MHNVRRLVLNSGGRHLTLLRFHTHNILLFTFVLVFRSFTSSRTLVLRVVNSQEIGADALDCWLRALWNRHVELARVNCLKLMPIAMALYLFLFHNKNIN